MQKAILERFINKYSLTGVPERAKWVSDGESVIVRFISEDQALAGSVLTTHLKLPVGKFVVYEAAQLKSMLSALGDEIELSVKRHKERDVAFLLTDKSTKATFALGDESISVKVPVIVEADSPAVSIVIDSNFVTTFTRAATALSSQAFTIQSDGTKATLTVGTSKEQNTNQISMSLNATCSETLAPVAFMTSYLKAIIMANKESTGTMKVQKVGRSTMATLVYSVDGYEVKYLIGQMNNNG